MNKKLETIETYNRGAEVLGKMFNEIGPRRADVERAMSYSRKKNPKVIELGCGNGRDAKEILKFTTNYLGLDASETMIKLAKEYLPEANFLVADIETFDYPLDVDIVFAFASLLHFDKEGLKIIFDKIYKSLVPGGIFYISVKHDKYQEKIKTDQFGSRYFYYYHKSDLVNIAGKEFELVYSAGYRLKGVDWLVVVFKKLA